MRITYFNSLSNKTIAIITIILILVSSNINWGRSYWKNIIEADAKGYYAYLPALFIYHDLNFGFFNKIEKETHFDKNTFYDYRSSFKGKMINKYYAGTALAQVPFFAMAHFLSYLSGYETDGYSKLYLIFINIAALFYLLCGIIFLNKILINFKINEVNRAIVLFTSVFGTNIFYYTIGECGMSHVYSFAFVSIFAFYIQQYFKFLNRRFLIYIGFALGMIVLIRPINILVLLFVPFLAESPLVFTNGLKALFKRNFALLISTAIFIGIISIQVIIYKISTGSFFVYSYTNEGFNFDNPQIINLLFSYKKGLFLYTPIYLVSLFGLWHLYRKSKIQFLCWVIAFSLILYILSSWWNWYYGGSFSSRVFIEYLPFFMILLGILLQNERWKIRKWLLITSIVALVLICQIQTFQYRYNTIHWSEMTQEKYWDVFLRIKLN